MKMVAVEDTIWLDLISFNNMVQSQIPVHHILSMAIAQTGHSKAETQFEISVPLPVVMEHHSSHKTYVFMAIAFYQERVR